MYVFLPTRTFRKSLKRYAHQPKQLENITKALAALQKDGALPNYGEHTLKGRFANFQECHILPDLLLVYRVLPDAAEIILHDIGSHSHIFG